MIAPAEMKETATIIIVYDPDDEEEGLKVTCTFDPEISVRDGSVVSKLAMEAVKRIGQVCAEAEESVEPSGNDPTQPETQTQGGVANESKAGERE